MGSTSARYIVPCMILIFGEYTTRKTLGHSLASGKTRWIVTLVEVIDQEGKPGGIGFTIQEIMIMRPDESLRVVAGRRVLRRRTPGTGLQVRVV